MKKFWRLKLLWSQHENIEKFILLINRFFSRVLFLEGALTCRDLNLGLWGFSTWASLASRIFADLLRAASVIRTSGTTAFFILNVKYYGMYKIQI